MCSHWMNESQASWINHVLHRHKILKCTYWMIFFSFHMVQFMALTIFFVPHNSDKLIFAVSFNLFFFGILIFVILYGCMMVVMMMMMIIKYASQLFISPLQYCIVKIVFYSKSSNIFIDNKTLNAMCMLLSYVQMVAIVQ